MRELIRTSDAVRLSWLTALLAGADIHAVVVDSHMSILEGSASAIPRRVLVADEDHEDAVALLVDAGELDGPPAARQGTPNTLLNGRVVLHQPPRGYRVAIDAVLLAAAVPAVGAGRVLDVGTGVGAAALCYASRVPGAQVVGLELQPDLATLARRNAVENRMEDRVAFVTGDLLEPPADVAAGGFDHVMANPPYLEPDHADAQPDASKRLATVEGEARLADWIGFGLSVLAPKGTLTLIHRADRLEQLVTLLSGRTGGLLVVPLWPTQGRDAKRVIVRARKGVRTPSRLAAGMALHEGDGEYTAAAHAILRDGEPLPF